VHNDEGQCVSPIILPVAVAEDLDAGLDLDHALFGRRQNNATREEKASERLQVSAAQAAPRQKCWRLSLRSPHNLILNGAGGENRPS